MRLRFKQICIGRHMVISNRENRKREITTGNLIQMSICLDTENKEFQMAHQKLFVLRDKAKTSQKQSSPKKQQKISKVSPLTSQDNQRIQVKDKIQDQTTFMEFQTCKDQTHGTPLDAFTENQMLKKYYLIKIQENQ